MAEVQKHLSYCSEPEKVENMDHIRAMEQSLKESLNHIQIHKENFAKQHLIGLQCAAAQFQTDMQLPLGLTSEPGPSSWFQNGGADGQQAMMLPDDSSLLHQRDIAGCSTSTSLQGYPGYFSMPKQEMDTERLCSVASSLEVNSILNNISSSLAGCFLASYDLKFDASSGRFAASRRQTWTDGHAFPGNGLTGGDSASATTTTRAGMAGVTVHRR